MGENIKAPPKAMPPRVDFFKKERRLFSCTSVLLLFTSSITSKSFNPISFKNFCEGVMIVFFYMYVNDEIFFNFFKLGNKRNKKYGIRKLNHFYVVSSF